MSKRVFIIVPSTIVARGLRCAEIYDTVAGLLSE